MRRVSNAVVRSLVVLSMMVVLAAPMQARETPNEDFSWREMARVRIIKILKKLTGGVVSFGDGLIDPRP